MAGTGLIMLAVVVLTVGVSVIMYGVSGIFQALGWAVNKVFDTANGVGTSVSGEGASPGPSIGGKRRNRK